MTEIVTTPALGMSYQVSLDKEGRRTIVFQAHVAVDTTLEQINTLLDKMSAAADRRAAIYELVDERRKADDFSITARTVLVQRTELEAAAEARYEASSKRGDWTVEKLPAKEAAARHNLNVSIERYESELERAKLNIERLEKVVGYGPNGGSNSHAGQSGG